MTRPNYPHKKVIAPDIEKCCEAIAEWKKRTGASYRELAVHCGLHHSRIHAFVRYGKSLGEAELEAVFRAMGNK